jgi:hypothetical protein
MLERKKADYQQSSTHEHSTYALPLRREKRVSRVDLLLGFSEYDV